MTKQAPKPLKEKEQIKKGTLLYVKVEERDNWEMRFFHSWGSLGILPQCYTEQDYDPENYSLKEYFDYSITNPLNK